jgi:hypothetical protein
MALMVQSSILRIRLHFLTWRHPETLSFRHLSESEEWRSLFSVRQIEIVTGGRGFSGRPKVPTRRKKNEAHGSIVWLANEE